jgi:hypothetical protein
MIFPWKVGVAPIDPQLDASCLQPSRRGLGICRGNHFGFVLCGTSSRDSKQAPRDQQGSGDSGGPVLGAVQLG